MYCSSDGCPGTNVRPDLQVALHTVVSPDTLQSILTPYALGLLGHATMKTCVTMYLWYLQTKPKKTVLDDKIIGFEGFTYSWKL